MRFRPKKPHLTRNWQVFSVKKKENCFRGKVPVSTLYYTYQASEKQNKNFRVTYALTEGRFEVPTQSESKSGFADLGVSASKGKQGDWGKEEEGQLTVKFYEFHSSFFSSKTGKVDRL